MTNINAHSLKESNIKQNWSTSGRSDNVNKIGINDKIKDITIFSTTWDSMDGILNCNQ